MYNRKAFKQEAKQLLHASTPHFMLVALVYVLLTTGLSYAVSWLTNGDELLAGTLSVFLNILVALFSIVMSMGFTNYALRLARREPTGMGSLFAAFSFSGRALGVQLLVTLYIILWGLLITAAFSIVVGLLAAFQAWPFLWTSLIAVYIAAIVLIYAIALRYVMAPFALVDDPDAGVMEAIRRSVRIMRGHKAKFFVLELSFIGWEALVGLIACVVIGIGFAVSGTSWLLESLMAAENNLWAIYDITRELMVQMALWTLLAEVLSLPLSLWLMVYRQTAAARFYNYVGGYDYHQYMNEQQSPAPGTPLTPPDQEPQKPNPPAGGYYTPPVQDTKPDEKPEQPQTPPSQDNYYTSILPPEAPKTPDEDEEL